MLSLNQFTISTSEYQITSKLFTVCIHRLSGLKVCKIVLILLTLDLISILFISAFQLFVGVETTPLKVVESGFTAIIKKCGLLSIYVLFPIEVIVAS